MLKSFSFSLLFCFAVLCSKAAHLEELPFSSPTSPLSPKSPQLTNEEAAHKNAEALTRKWYQKVFATEKEQEQEREDLPINPPSLDAQEKKHKMTRVLNDAFGSFCEILNIHRRKGFALFSPVQEALRETIKKRRPSSTSSEEEESAHPSSPSNPKIDELNILYVWHQFIMKASDADTDRTLKAVFAGLYDDLYRLSLARLKEESHQRAHLSEK